MKKLVSILFALAIIFPLQAFAVAGFGVEAGYASWSQDGSGQINTTTLPSSSNSPSMIWAQVVHPVPFVPNVRIASSNFTTGNGTDGLNLNQTDTVLFYNLWDTVATVDVGLGMRSMSGSVYAASLPTSVSVSSPFLYYNLAAKIPGIGLTVGYRSSGLNISGVSLADSEAYVDYEFAFGLGVTAGMRSQSLVFSSSGYNVDNSGSGMFIGVMYKLD